MDFAIAQRPKIGNLVNGDACLVQAAGSYLVVAMSDGLGSGEKAYASSKLALQGVSEHATAALSDVLNYCHYIILAAGGVGVMMTIVRLDTATAHLEYAGVGNVRFLAHSSRVIQPITRYGYLGLRLPSLHTAHLEYDPGDAFVLHTDGISTRFHLSNHLRELEQGAQALADRALQEYGKGHDDAAIVVVQT